MDLLTKFRNMYQLKPVQNIRALNNDRVIKPDNTPLYMKRGWKKNGRGFNGYYRTKYGAWRGEIIRRGDIFEVFIFNPPMDKIKEHNRSACFWHQYADMWKINLAINPKDKDIGAIIFNVERIIMESFEGKNRRPYVTNPPFFLQPIQFPPLGINTFGNPAPPGPRQNAGGALPPTNIAAELFNKIFNR